MYMILLIVGEEIMFVATSIYLNSHYESRHLTMENCKVVKSTCPPWWSVPVS